MALILVYIAGAFSALVCLFFAGTSLRKRELVPEPSPANGVYVEVDCRECSKLNRVPAERLRDRPICGGCKKTLAPHRRMVICRVTSMPPDLSSDLTRDWSSPAHLWDRIADHLSTPKKSVN
jgi:hypothetical protein